MRMTDSSVTNNPKEMEMTTEFERLLDNLDAAYVAHNEFFEEHFSKWWKDEDDSALPLTELAEFDKRIEEAHKELDKCMRAANGDWHKLSDIASARAHARPQKMTRWLDPKVVREEARKHAGRQNHSVWNGKSLNELKKYREGSAECQAKIDAQGGKCIQCGEPIDIFQQMMTDRNGRLRCDVCINEEMMYPHHIILGS
jgi:hypothetical protein